jgi:predicted kinase
MMPRLHFAIGCQRSGKSTIATQWMNYEDEEELKIRDYRPRVVVCGDSIRIAMHGRRYNPESEPMVFAIKNYMIRSLLHRGHDVWVDGTHTTETSIRRILEIDLDAVPHLIETPKEECLRRAIATNQRDLIPIIERTYEQFLVLKERGIDKVLREIREDILSRKV